MVADVPEPPPELNTKHTVVLELTTRVTRALPALGAVRPRGDMTAFDFVNSDAATRAALAGGPEAPIPVPHASEARFFQDKDLSEVSLWRVKAPGFAGRLFFVGPQVTLFPVNVFALETTREASLDAAVLTLTQIRGEMEGTPGAVVRWINGAYRAERTVTSVRVDPARATITTSLDLRVVVEVPAPFRWVDKKKSRWACARRSSNRRRMRWGRCATRSRRRSWSGPARRRGVKDGEGVGEGHFPS